MEAAYVSGVGSHDGQVVVVNDLLHQLDTSEVSEHVSDRDDVSVLDKRLGDILGTLDCASSDRLQVSSWTEAMGTCQLKEAYLLDEVSDLGEELEEGELEIGSLGGTTSVSWGTSNNNGAEDQLVATTNDKEVMGDVLWVLDVVLLEIRVVIFDGLEDLGIPVCGFDERGSLAF